MKSERGSLTLIAFYTLLVFSLYGMLLYGRSASAVIKQNKMIVAIQKTYARDVYMHDEIARNVENNL